MKRTTLLLVTSLLIAATGYGVYTLVAPTLPASLTFDRPEDLRFRFDDVNKTLTIAENVNSTVVPLDEELEWRVRYDSQAKSYTLAFSQPANPIGKDEAVYLNMKDPSSCPGSSLELISFQTGTDGQVLLIGRDDIRYGACRSRAFDILTGFKAALRFDSTHKVHCLEIDY